MSTVTKADPATPAGSANALNRRRPLGDRGFQILTLAAGLLVLVILVLITYTTAQQSATWFSTAGFKGIFSVQFDGNTHFGAMGVLYGTVISSVIGIIIGVPVSVGIALLLTQVVPARWARPFVYVIDLLAVVPSVVWGLWGIIVLVPWLQKIYMHIASGVNGIPVLDTLFGGPNVSGASFFTAGLILAIMVTPIIASLSREVIATVPDIDKEGAYALGATRWEMIRGAVWPHSQGGVGGAILVGLGRALGDGAGDHAREGATWLTGVHPKKTEGVGIRAGISADQLAARELAKNTQLASLELGLEGPSLAGGCDSGYSCAYTNTVSWRSDTTPLPVEINPRAVFERLFGDGESTDPAARLAALQQQRSILDYVSGSIDRLETKLGKSDRNKLSEYLDAIRDVERRIQKAEQQSAGMVIPSMERPSSVPEEFEDHARLMMDLQVIAWQTDMTRVITFMLGRAGSNRPYRNIGISDGHHSITHHQNDPVKIANVAKIDAYLVRTFAYFLQKLKDTPDGDGNLLDHSLILNGSGLGDANVHTHHELPTAVLGGGAGQMKGGRHLNYPRDTPLNNLLVSLLHKGGVRTENFGDATGELEHLSGI